MNRDERRDRCEGGVHSDADSIYPVDLQSGGTWCGVNAHGLGLTLLNRYQSDYTLGSISRGGIIPLALQAKTLAQVTSIVNSLDLASYNPFTLLAMSATETYGFVWNGSDFNHASLSTDPWAMLTSSSWESERVLNLRHQRFEKWSVSAQASLGVVPDIHLNQSNWHKSESIFMQRTEAHTKSISQFSLKDHEIGFNYYQQNTLPELCLNPLISPSVSTGFGDY